MIDSNDLMKNKKGTFPQVGSYEMILMSCLVKQERVREGNSNNSFIRADVSQSDNI
jgi:hypothetical protein